MQRTMQRTMQRWPLALLALTLAGNAVACNGPTELVVVVDSNLVVPRELDEVQVEIASPDGTTRTASQALVDGPDLPLTLGVRPDSSDQLGPITVRATGRLGGAEVVSTEATVSLVAGSSRALHLYLLRSCVGRDCGADTCGVTGCEPVARDSLEAWSDVTRPLPNDACLAAPWDVDGDGDGDARCGGGDCDDRDPLRFSDKTEACDDVDDDCDGQVDEGCPCVPLGATQACVTACGTDGIETCEAGMWGACAPPAEVCNATDDDCDGRVDEGFAYAPVDAREVQRDRGTDALVVWAGDRFVVAWAEELREPGIWALTIRPDGTEITPATQLSVGYPYGFDLATDGTTLGLASWGRISCGSSSTCDVIRLRRFDLATLGELGEYVQLDSNAATNPRVRLLWDGASWVVTWSDGGVTEVERRTLDGAMVVGAPFTTDRGGDEADALWTGTRLLLAKSDGTNLTYRFSLGEMFEPPITVLAERSERPEVAATRDGLLLAYMGVSPRVARVLATDPAGVPLGPPVDLGLAGFRPNPQRERELGLAVAGDHAIVGWIEATGDEHPTFARVDATGAIVQPPTPLDLTPRNGRQVRLATDGATFWAAWSSDSPETVEIARLACPGPP